MKSEGLTIDSWMVGWSVARGERSPMVRVGPWPDETMWSNRYEFTDGCCWTSWSDLPPADKVAQMMLCQLRCIDDGVDPRQAHAEFMRIREYRDYAIASQGRPFYPVSVPPDERLVMG